MVKWWVSFGGCRQLQSSQREGPKVPQTGRRDDLTHEKTREKSRMLYIRGLLQ